MQHVPKSGPRRPGDSPPATRQHPPGTKGTRRRALPGALVVILLAALLAVAAPTPAGAASATPYQRPLGVGGAEPNGYSTVLGASADGSMVMVNSSATNLVPNDTNDLPDAFVWNRTTGTVMRQPLGVGGQQPNGRSRGDAISADGTKLVFSSEADNLVPNWPFVNDGDESSFAYVWDLVTGKVTPQPINNPACKAGRTLSNPTSMSPDGSLVTLYGADCSKFPGDPTPARSVQVWNVLTGKVESQPAAAGGAEPNGGSEVPVLSFDTTKVVMQSYASNLITNDPSIPPGLPGEGDVYVWNRPAGTYQRQPLGLNGEQPNASSRPAAISKDNSKVLFGSYASNLVAGDTNGQPDVFVWNRWTGTYQRQARGVDGRQPNAGSTAIDISADGTKVLIESTATNLVAENTGGRLDLFIWDRTTGLYTHQPNGLLGQQPNASSNGGAISADGTKVAMSSYASNLVANDTNNTQAPFVWDLTAMPPPSTGYQRQPLGVNGAQPNGPTGVSASSADGSAVLLTSSASNLLLNGTDPYLRVFVWNRNSGAYERQPAGVDGLEPRGNSYGVGISGDGTKVLFASSAPNLPGGEGNAGEWYDTYVWDRTTGKVTRQPPGKFPNEPCDFGQDPPLGVSLQSLPKGISADGNLVLFSSNDCSYTPGKVDAFKYEMLVWNRTTGTVQRQPLGLGGAQPNGSVIGGAFSPDGSKAALQTTASNLVKGDTSNAPDINGLPDTYVWNRSTGLYERQPLGVNGAQPNGESRPAAVSKDNSKVLLTTAASNLLPGDTNGFADVYIWNRWSVAYQRQPLGVGGAQPNGESTAVAISADGTKVLLWSAASNLVAGDTNGVSDVFVWDRSTGKYTRQAPGLAGTQPNGASTTGAMSADASTLFLPSLANNLVTGDTNNVQDVFAWTR
jgi:hypothetical protein